MQAEVAISGWQQWNAGLLQKPEIIRPLDGGRSNRSYLLRSGDQHLVMRLNASSRLLPDSNRSNEIRVWQAASAAGLAPPLLYSNERESIQISAYVPDSLPARPEADTAIADHALNLLGRCHQLDVAAPNLDYARHIRRYWQLIEAGGHSIDPSLSGQREHMQGLVDSLSTGGAVTALCHHDPVRANFVGSTDRLYLIDWEYAARGWVVMDYAALLIEWNMDDQSVLARPGVEPDQLAMAKQLYRYTCALWTVLNNPGAAPG